MSYCAGHTTFYRISTYLLAGFICALLPLHRAAAMSEMVDLCHFDEEIMTWKKITVAAAAVDPLLTIVGFVLPGDTDIGLDENCEPIVPPRIFARAWIDVTADGGYDPTEDLEIARVEDADGNALLSTGDVVIVSFFPTTFDETDPQPIVATVASHEITAVLLAGPVSLVLSSDDGENTYYFTADSDGEEYRELDSVSGIGLIGDGHTELVGDIIIITADSPSAPDLLGPISLALVNNSDDHFLEVAIDLTGNL